jgi:adenylate kinase
MRLIVLGPPGAGKGTQSARICAKYGVSHVSTGDIFRAAVQAGTALGEEVSAHVREGRLVPDDVAVRVVRERLGEPDLALGFVLDGFPRTHAQALALGKALAEDGIALDAALWLDVPAELLVSRIEGRRLDPLTQRIYHLDYAPPPAEARGRLTIRDDDTPERLRVNLANYEAATVPLRELYAEREMLIPVDGAGTLEQVTARVYAALSAFRR